MLHETTSNLVFDVMNWYTYHGRLYFCDAADPETGDLSEAYIKLYTINNVYISKNFNFLKLMDDRQLEDLYVSIFERQKTQKLNGLYVDAERHESMKIFRMLVRKVKLVRQDIEGNYKLLGIYLDDITELSGEIVRYNTVELGASRQWRVQIEENGYYNEFVVAFKIYLELLGRYILSGEIMMVLYQYYYGVVASYLYFSVRHCEAYNVGQETEYQNLTSVGGLMTYSLGMDYKLLPSMRDNKF